MIIHLQPIRVCEKKEKEVGAFERKIHYDEKPKMNQMK